MYILKTLTVIIILLFTNISNGSLLSYNLSSYKLSRESTYTNSLGIKETKSMDEVVPEWRISPSLNLDFYVEEVNSNRSSTGLVPGIGYGLRWNPKWWAEKDFSQSISSNYLVSIDIYIKGSMSDEINMYDGNDYFVIDVLPAITLFDWVSIGYGYRWKRSQHKELNNDSSAIFSFGIRKGL